MSTFAQQLRSPGAAGAAGPGDTPWSGWIVTLVAALITPVGYLGNEGIAPLVAVAGLLTLPHLLNPKLHRPALFRLRAPSLGIWLLAALTVWAATSYFRSPVASEQLSDLHRYDRVQALVAPKLVFQLVLYGAFLDSAIRLAAPWRRRVLWTLTVSCAVTIAVLLLDAAAGGGLYGRISELVGQHWRPDLAKRNAARGCYGAVVLVWPVAALLWRRALAAGAALALFAAAVEAVLLGVDAPAAAVIAGLGAFALVRWLGRWGVWACLGAAVTYHLAAPWVFLTQAASGEVLPADVGKMSWRLRLIIWRFASHRVVERPLFGWGLDSSRAWPDHIPMHPHDAAIQLWLETGLVGAVLAALFWAWLFWRIAEVERFDRTAAAVMAATAAAYLVIGAISFGVWQEWWLALGAFAIAACALLSQLRRDEGPISRDEELVELA